MKNSYEKFLKECKEYKNKQLKLVSVKHGFPLIILLIGISTITTIYVGGLEPLKEKLVQVTSQNLSFMLTFTCWLRLWAGNIIDTKLKPLKNK